jgi:hypothetical protein
MPQSAIHQAAYGWDKEALRRELEDGVSPNAREPSGNQLTPLHKLAVNNTSGASDDHRIKTESDRSACFHLCETREQI